MRFSVFPTACHQWPIWCMRATAIAFSMVLPGSGLAIQQMQRPLGSLVSEPRRGQFCLMYTQHSTRALLCLLVMQSELSHTVPAARAHAAMECLTRASGHTGAWGLFPPPTSTTVRAQCAAAGALLSLPWKHPDALTGDVQWRCSSAWSCLLASLHIRAANSGGISQYRSLKNLLNVSSFIVLPVRI